MVSAGRGIFTWAASGGLTGRRAGFAGETGRKGAWTQRGAPHVAQENTVRRLKKTLCICSVLTGFGKKNLSPLTNVTESPARSGAGPWRGTGAGGAERRKLRWNLVIPTELCLCGLWKEALA